MTAETIDVETGLSQTINKSTLRPGDVFLYYRSHGLGRAIRLLDGGDFSHAALYTGDGRLTEAIGSGVRSVPVEVSLGDEPGDWIAAFRRKPEVPDDQLVPVIGMANQFVADGTHYAYQDVFLCAGLALTRRLPLSRLYKALLRRILDRAAGVISDLAIGNRARPLMCSELVFTCYLKAAVSPPGALTLTITGWRTGDDGAESVKGPRAGSLLDLARKLSTTDDLPPRTSLPPRADLQSESATNSIPDDLDDLVEACEREDRNGSSESAGGGLDEETVESMQGLAQALRDLEKAQRQAQGVEEGLLDPPGLKELERWFSHLISPRDLQKSSSLRRLGRLVLT